MFPDAGGVSTRSRARIYQNSRIIGVFRQRILLKFSKDRSDFRIGVTSAQHVASRSANRLKGVKADIQITAFGPIADCPKTSRLSSYLGTSFHSQGRLWHYYPC